MWDEHSTEPEDMWTCPGQSAWIQFDFDRCYKLQEMLVWNYNATSELLLGIGAKNVVVSYSADGENWVALECATQFERATGRATDEANTKVAFGDVAAQAVRVEIKSNWGGMLSRFGLSELRFLTVPVFAREPKPASGAVDIDPENILLTWRAGREAAVHDVYFGPDPNALSLLGTVETNSFDLNTYDLRFGETYYWKIHEVNDTTIPTTWESPVWTFSTRHDPEGVGEE